MSGMFSRSTLMTNTYSGISNITSSNWNTVFGVCPEPEPEPIIHQFTSNLELKQVVDKWTGTPDKKQEALQINGHISNWDVSQITDMGNLFRDKTSFNEDINSWDVSNVTNMNSMFKGAETFNQNLICWNVSKVTDMSEMFHGATEMIANYVKQNTTDEIKFEIGGGNISSFANLNKDESTNSNYLEFTPEDPPYKNIKLVYKPSIQYQPSSYNPPSQPEITYLSDPQHFNLEYRILTEEYLEWYDSNEWNVQGQFTSNLDFSIDNDKWSLEYIDLKLSGYSSHSSPSEYPTPGNLYSSSSNTFEGAHSILEITVRDITSGFWRLYVEDNNGVQQFRE